MTADLAHVLVVDDDARLRELLRRYLTENGFRVATAANAGEARLRMADLAFDLIVLDVMMPAESGLELTHDLRRTTQVPILLLTAMGEVDDRIKGLESGADDYLAKPFEPRELVLRLRTILKRTTPPPAPLRPAAVRLGAEAALLTVFAERPGVTLTRDDLSAAGIAAAQARTVDVQVTRLRRKIEPDPKFPRYLQTVRGKGYVLQPD